MKLTDLHDVERNVGPVPLHPHVTVVQTGSDTRRSAAVDSIAGRLEPLGVERSALVVTTADLPGHDPVLAAAIADRDAAAAAWDRSVTGLKACRAELTRTIEERARVAAELEEVLRGEGPARDVVAAQQAERTRLEARLAAVRQHREACEATLVKFVSDREALQHALDAATARVYKARQRRQTAMDEALAVAVELEATQAAAPSTEDPRRDLTAARERLTVAEQEAAAADPDSASSPVNQRLADLERHRVHLSRRLAATGSSAEAEVAAALERVRTPVDGSPPMAAALALADTWRDLHQQLHALDSAVSDSERDAQARLDAAKRAVDEADLAARRPVLTSEQIATVEAAHLAVLEAEGRRGGRFGSGRSQRKVEDLRAREAAVLGGLGFDTYADFMISSSGPVAGTVHDLEVAHADLVVAQAALDAIPGAADRARRRIELLARRDAVGPKVAALIGHEPSGPEAEAELRRLREPATDDAAGLERLAAALRAAGIEVDDGPHLKDDLVLLAESYLAEDQRAGEERSDLVGAVEAVDAVIASLRAARDRGEVEVPPLPALPPTAEPSPAVRNTEDAARTLREARWSEVESARAAVEEAEALVSRQAEWSEQIDRLEAQMATVARREREVADALATVEAELAEVAGDGERLTAATEAVADAEGALTKARLAEFEAEAAIAGLNASNRAADLEASCTEALRRAEEAVRDAAADEQAEAVGLAAAEALLQETTAAVEAAEPAEDDDRSGLLDAFEWALIRRLAGIRGTEETGPLPLILDDPFGSLRDDEVAGVLDSLSRVAPLVQIVVISDRPAVAEWADAIGSDRAAVAVA